MNKKVTLSIIIVNYNTKELLADCLDSIKRYENEIPLEVIVADNSSSDGSTEMLRSKYPWVILDEGKNLGFNKANNRVKHFVNGELVLFLNPDTKLTKGALFKTVAYFKDNPKVGALSCKLVLANGELDKDARRSFPTPWVAFSHLVLRADRIFPKSKLFARYWMGYVSSDIIQEVDAIEGAFILTSKKILDKVGWFTEDYFLDGEDLDLCFKIKKAGYKVIYYPKVFIYHFKGVAKGKGGKNHTKVPFSIKAKSRLASVESMEIFYRKNLWGNYPLVFNWFVIGGIKLFKLLRLTKLAISGK